MNKPAPHWIGSNEPLNLAESSGSIKHDFFTGWWYSTDESGYDLYGPFHTRRDAEEWQLDYADSL